MSQGSYTHVQENARLVWTVGHALGMAPSITVTDLNGATLSPSVQYVNNLVARLTFASPASGYAYCNKEDQVYAVEIDDVGGGVTYVGEAVPGTATSDSKWRIKKIAETGSDLVITWAGGSAGFTNIWDNRLSLSYS